MFDNRGQSALEYLMTYGWALIVIAIVIGVLIFVTSGATGGITCQSQSTGIVVKNWAITAASAGLSLQNTTGSDINVTGVSSLGNIVAGTTNINGAAIVGGTPITKNSTFSVTGFTATAGNFATGSGFTISYKIGSGVSALPATASVECNGTL